MQKCGFVFGQLWILLGEVKNYVKAALLFSPAIASWKLAFGHESNNYKMFAYCYPNLVFALEKSNHLLEAKTAYRTSIGIKMQAHDYENKEERYKCISTTQNGLQIVENKLKNKYFEPKVLIFENQISSFLFSGIRFVTIIESL